MIKKIISIIAVSFLFLNPDPSFAQVQCSSITPENQVECCNGNNYVINEVACNQYQPPVTSCNPVTDANFSFCCKDIRNLSRQCNNYLTGTNTVEGTINSSGAPNTNPQNSGPSSPGTISPTPQASSSQLKSCNAIAFDSLLDILIWLKCIIGAAIIPLVFTLAFLFFLWGVINYMRNADNEKKREESKKFIYWGIIGLTVMVSVWGIVKIVNSTFGFGDTVPALQTDYLKAKK